MRECFEDNCGYCGVGMGRRLSESGKMLPVGKVDHFLPKSQCPLYVYYWENYIWCCTDCNETKREYYDPDCMLFYPCDKEDTRMLELRTDGKYCLKNEFDDDEDVIKRYQATCRKTLMNFGVHPKERSAKKNELEILLSGLMGSWNTLRSNDFEDLPPQIKLFIQKNFKELKSRLKHILESSSYKKMIHSIMEQFLEKEPVLYEIMDNPVNPLNPL